MTERVVRMRRAAVAVAALLAASVVYAGETPKAGKLLPLLKHRDPAQRLYAVRGLGSLKTASAVEPLIGTLDDTDAHVREAAASALGAIGDARAVPPLIAALKHKHVPLRAAAAAALGELKDARAVAPLIEALDNAEQVQTAAVAALAAIGAPALEPLVAALKAKAPAVPPRAAEALGALGDKRAVEPLLAVLKTADRRTVCSAAEALGKLGAPRATKPLTDLLAKKPRGAHPYMPMRYDPRVAAAKALGTLGDKEAIPALKTAAKNRNRQLAKAAADALKAIAGKP